MALPTFTHAAVYVHIEHLQRSQWWYHLNIPFRFNRVTTIRKVFKINSTVEPIRYTLSKRILHSVAPLIRMKQQGIHRHQTPPRYRNAASGSRLKVQPSTHRHTAHYGQT